MDSIVWSGKCMQIEDLGVEAGQAAAGVGSGLSETYLETVTAFGPHDVWAFRTRRPLAARQRNAVVDR